ncbi:N-acetylmuramoyl-L-alanine amidase family protein [Marinisporobacter balticus]|uniref:N-acetylmuramoyl-L-alanine amidase n=1 Tax=Marinisporobacter balticus TaxID=2018667 RepID=A0A4R2L1Y6_9FIRM|nr:N-acetylmuramoyl-L-alanine amidase [Marinisporobacter balticus]TCO79217.1 N-acetylmuramoyl-L-alanine amidase [Marinisporobacter balticus]
MGVRCSISRKKKKRLYRRLFSVLLIILMITGIIFCIDYLTKPTFTVCIDPGHGGYDTGAFNKEFNVAEKDLVLDIALRVGEILKDKNIHVVYTRDTDHVPWTTQNKSLKGRSKIANDVGADIFISIHANYFKDSSKVKGTEVWCRFKNTESENLAKEISDKFKNIGFTKNRGLRYERDKGLYVLRNTNGVAVLVELGYLSNVQDTEILISEEGKKGYANAISEAIMNYRDNQEKSREKQYSEEVSVSKADVVIKKVTVLEDEK